MSQNVEDVYPLTPLQEGMLFHTLEAPGTGVYVERLSCDLRGDADTAVFRSAWEAAVARHPALRTAFLWQGLEEPLQVVRRSVRLPWREEDWRGLDSGEREERLAAWLAEDLSRGFDVARAPLMRIALFRFGERCWRLVWTHHHLLLDGWARVHVMTDVLALYERARRGIPGQLPPVRPFRDYLAWLKGPGARDLQGAEAFWRQTLAGFTTPTRLALAAGPGPAGEQEDAVLVLSAAATAALQEGARRERVTLNTLFQAAWALLLARSSGAADVVYGNVVSGRPASLPGAEAMVGPFINTLPVRARLRPAEAAGGWLRRFQEELAAQRRYEHSPLLQVQAWSEVPRGTPLFETLAVFENHPAGDSKEAFRELEVDELVYDSKVHYPVSLIADMDLKVLRLRLKHELAAMDGTTASRLLARLETLLAGLAAGADRPVSELPYLSGAEICEILARSAPAGNRRPPLPDSLTLHGLVAARAAAAPDAIAVEHDGDLLTYGELERRASVLASRLRRQGVGPGSVVGLEVERSPAMVVGMLAILKAGAAYLPLDPSHPSERRRALLADAGAALLLTGQNLDEGLDAGDGGPEPAISADALAYVIYTSGSTGVPKGVAISHRGVLRFLVDTDYLRLETHDVMAQVSTPAFDAATFEIWGALLAGARLSIFGRYESLHPPDFATGLRERGITTIVVTAALFSAVAREMPDAFAGVRHLLIGGDVMDPGATRAILAAGPPQRLLNTYGPTECTTFCIWHLVSEVPGKTVPIGSPIAGARALVHDLWGGLTPDGFAGELYLGGDGLAHGYLGRPDLTAERFVPDPLEPGLRLYRTGDLVRRGAGGALEFLGRMDHQVKIRGVRIEPGEVEAVLRGLPEVSDALVAALPDPLGGRRLVAWWVRGAGATTAEDLRVALRALLPGPMVPSAFVEMDELPLNANGKVDHGRLPAPEDTALSEAPSESLPLTPIQERLAGILSAVLGAERPRAIRPRDSFLDLGGHSLLATRVVSRVRAAFGVDLPLGAVLNEPTVAALAARIETLMQGEARAEGAPLAPVPRGAGLPLSFAQERLWFLDRMLPGSPLYNVPMAVRAHGRLDTAAFAAALQAVIGRHEILRTTYGTEGGLPVQRIAGEVLLSIPEIDLRGLAPETGETEARRLAGTEARRPFDLAAGPLLRVSLLRMAGDERLVLATFHHMVADGWSLDVLLRDLAAFYRGEAPPPLPVQYADYAIWQRRQLSGAALEAELAYWRQALAGIPWVLELPADRPRPPVLTYRGAREPFHLPAETAARAAALGRSEEATPFMVLLALFAILLARLADREELIVGTPVANRDRIETEGLIGFFMNTLALRISLQGEPGLTALLLRVREVALAAYAHQELPFEKLIEELRPARDLARAPLVQVMFTLLAAGSPVALPGVELTPALDDAAESGTARFDLSLHLNAGAEGLAGAFEYNLDLFDAATVRRFAGAYATLIAAAVADPGLPFWELPLLTPEERVQLLAGWNDTAAPLPRETAVHRWIEEQARRRPEAVAVVDGERALTYTELDTRAGALARRLAARGLGPERCVALHLERSAEMVVALLAVMKTGGAWLPLDPGHPAERLARILEDAGNPPVLAGGDLLGIAEETAAPPLPAPFLDPDGLAYVIFTSGSTGRPKGVQVVRRGLANFLASMRQRPGLGRSDVLLAVTTLAFDISGLELLLPLTVGARVVIAGREDAADGTRLAALLAGHGATAMQATPATWRLLLEGGWQAPSGFKVLCGGEALPGELAARLGAQGAEVWNLYGPTETTIWSAVEPVDPARAAERAVVSLGRPIANTRIHIAGRGLEPVPAGVPGELLIGGVGLARGYLGRPDLTAERFVPDPLGGRGERLYRTGDLARRLPDGRLEFLGRLDHQVKVRGYRIELGEIEAALAEHPAVRHAVVVARPGPGGERRLVAYAETADGVDGTLALDQVRAFLRDRLPDYMLPAAFVTMDRLPLNPSGKVDRRALPDPSPERPVLAVEYIAPREGREALLAALWSELLGVERVGIRDNFFDLGGHSLLLMRLQGRLAAETGVDLPVLELFEHPTIAALAKRLDELGGPVDGAAGFTAGMNDRAEELRRGKERRAQRRRASEVEV